MRIRRLIAIVIAALITLVLAVIALPPLLVRDAAPPTSLAPFVDGARAEIRSHSIEGPWFWWPLHLRFVEARCSPDRPGHVALIFEEWRPPYTRVTYAAAWRGSMPTSPDDGWAGGLGMDSIFDDDEFVYQMGTNTIPCP